mmetsp:Transcript_22879/g.32778  ORF Transcript_22879/g.32778 Transcript_22879/m.32778 type:complete len:84 (-) Transcript_22879:29-280(-)
MENPMNAMAKLTSSGVFPISSRAPPANAETVEKKSCKHKINAQDSSIHVFSSNFLKKKRRIDNQSTRCCSTNNCEKTDSVKRR